MDLINDSNPRALPTWLRLVFLALSMAFSIVASEKEPFLLRVNHQLPGFVGFSYSRAATRALNQGPPSRFISFLNEVREPIVLLCIVDIIESWE